MSWLATLHGDTSHLTREDAQKLEAQVKDELAELARDLVPDGHQGVAATFHGEHSGDVNLLTPGETPDAGQVPTEADGDPAQVPQLEIPRDTAQPADSGETGTDVELEPGQALAPTTPEAAVDAAGAPTGQGATDQAPEA